MDSSSGNDLARNGASSRRGEWERVLHGRIDQDNRILEIAPAKGDSTEFFLRFLPRSTITYVGPNEDGDRGFNDDWKVVETAPVENRFDSHSQILPGHVARRRLSSVSTLADLAARENVFDVVYINGAHHAADVWPDARMSWEMLRPGGVMILDDDGRDPSQTSPALGGRASIDAFLASLSGTYEVLHAEHQLILSKPVSNGVRLSLAGRQVAQIQPPLVSFVIVNWNYGRYIGATIDSILAQDYPHFECIIIDNGSTDDSRAVIDRHVRADRRFRVIHLPENLGQLGATLVALDEVKGGFVTFVDSDDLLFPNFASTHLQVHLSVPRSIAVTTSGVAEVDGAGVVLTSQYAAIQLDRHGAAKGLRDASTVIRLSTISDEQFGVLDELTAVIPRWTKGWLWAPGTGNMMRRSVLELVAFKERNSAYMRSADGHFLPLCHAFAGTALIDVPLSAYRIHGENYFVNRESLTGISNGTPEYAAKSRRESYQSVESLLENARRNFWLLKEPFWRVVDIATRVHSDDLKAYYGSPAGVEMFERHAVALREAVGDRAFVQNICARFSFKDSRKIIAKGFGGRMPVRLQLKIFRLCRNKRRMKALLH